MASGAVKTFDKGGGTYDYLTPTNWIGDTLPTSVEDVVFDNSLTTLTGQTVTLSGNTAVANSLMFGSASGTALGAFTFASNSTTARTFTLTSGNVTVDSSVTGTQTLGTGTTSGTLTLASSTGTVTFTNNSGTQALSVSNFTAPGMNIQTATSGGQISLEMYGGPSVGSLNGGDSNVIIQGTTIPSVNRTLTLTGTGTHTFAGNIGGTNGNRIALTLNSSDGSLVQTLTGTSNSYGGATTVTKGTLLLNSTLTSSGGVAVNGGAIGGSGSVVQTGVVTRTFTMAAGTKLMPGASSGTTGTFNISWAALSSSTVDLSAASNNTGTYVFDLAAPGSSDKVAINTGTNGFNVGQLDFSDFNFNALSGFGPGTYVLFDSNSNAGATADQHTLVGTIGTASGTISGYNATLSLDGTNDNVVLTVSDVPEPAAIGSLIGVGLIALRRRRKVS